MHGQKIGYIRVSSIDQNTERQLDGLTLDRAFTKQRAEMHAYTLITPDVVDLYITVAIK